MNNTIKQLEQTDIYRTLTTNKVEHTWHISLHHILSHKTNLKIFQRIKIIQSMFSDHNGNKLEIIKENYIEIPQ